MSQCWIWQEKQLWCCTHDRYAREVCGHISVSHKLVTSCDARTAGGIPCDFPFKWNGKKHYSCTIDDVQMGGQPWCSRVDGTWADCDCQGFGSHVISIDVTHVHQTFPVSHLDDKKDMHWRPQGLVEGIDTAINCSKQEQNMTQTKKQWCCQVSPNCTVNVTEFDCLAGLAQWETDWSLEKKVWCWSSGGQHDLFDCEDGVENADNGWSADKQDWCCRNKQLGCAPYFDCDNGLETWETSWNLTKKKWCWDHEQKGYLHPYRCEGTFADQEKWPSAKQDHESFGMYTASLSMVGFVLEAISAFFCFCLMLPYWGFAHCEGIVSGVAWMFMDRAIPDALMIGAIASLPVTEHEGKKTWFAPSWLAAFHLLRTWGKLLRAYKINMEMFRNQIIDAIVSTAFKVYLLAMMMLTFENLGEPQIFQSFSQEKWNTVSSLYFILTSVATVGFGDMAPVTSVGRLSTIFAIYFGLAWLATVAYRSLQILAVNQTGGGFFEPILHSKYIVIIGNPTGLMLRNFLAEIFHPDHAEDADDLHVSVILSPGHVGMDLVTDWLRQPENLQMLPRIHIFQGTALSEQDLNRVTISAATCVFILPNLLCRSVMQEDTENIIRMMAVQKYVPKVRFILLLLRAENRKLLAEAHMDNNVTTVAFDQFKLEMAGKSCMVHGSGPLLSNLCKSIAIDDDDEDDEDWEAEHKPQWKKAQVLQLDPGCWVRAWQQLLLAHDWLSGVRFLRPGMAEEGESRGLQVVQHPSGEEFLMILVHYSWIMLMVILLLALISYCAHRRHRHPFRRTTADGSEQAVHASPGLLAHGGYPFVLRGSVASIFFMLGVLPLFLVCCSVLLGLLVAAFEDWPASIGVEYLLSNVLGMTQPLTDIVPTNDGGIHFAIIVNMYAVILVTTAMGLVANMSLMTAMAKKVPESTCGFLGFLFIVTPVTMFIITWMIGGLMAVIEGWDFHDGYYFMAASMASLANPVGDAVPETALGAFFECLCLAIELCIGGCILGMVASHPATLKLCNLLEGSERPAGTQTMNLLQLQDLTKEDLRGRLKSIRFDMTLRLLPDDERQEIEKQLATFDDLDGKELSVVFVKMLEIHETIRSFPMASSTEDELQELRTRVLQLENLLSHQAISAMDDTGPEGTATDFERGCGLEVYEVELSPVYAQRDATFIEVVVDIIEQTGGLVYLVGLVEVRSDSKKVLVNPGPTFKIKQSMPGFKIMGIFLASDREAIMQCDVGMVFLGRRERISMEEGDVGREDDVGDAVQKLKVKEDDVPEMNHVSLKAEHKAAALHLARVARRHQRSLKPLRPPLKRLAVGGHIIVLAVGTETNEDLRLGIEHFVKPLRQNIVADELIPVVVVSAIQPRDWFNVENCDQVYFLQGSPTSLLDLQRANFTGASAIFITNAGAGSADAEKQESWTVDFEVICCTRLVESQLPVGSPTLVLSDIVVDSNHPFLPLYSLRDLKDVESFLRDRTLRQRLIEISEVAQGHLSNGVKPEALFGARVDVDKFRECCTCFALVALSNGDRPVAELMIKCLASLGGALDTSTVEHLSKELKDFAEAKDQMTLRMLQR
eukprot:s295_g35.t3